MNILLLLQALKAGRFCCAARHKNCYSQQNTLFIVSLKYSFVGFVFLLTEIQLHTFKINYFAIKI